MYELGTFIVRAICELKLIFSTKIGSLSNTITSRSVSKAAEAPVLIFRF